MIFGYYDKAPIALVQGNIFAQSYERAREQTRQHYQNQGLNIDDPGIPAFQRQSIDFQNWQHAFSQTVVHTAILQIIKRSNYITPERIVNKAVASLPHFQENGRFVPALYRRMPESTRLALWRQEQEGLAIAMFLNDTFNLITTEAETQFFSNMSSPMRIFEMVSFSIEDYPESEYLSYARQNSNLFNSIHMSKITFGSSEREARRILSSITEGTVTFEDAARNHSQDIYADRSGDMGSRFIYELYEEIPEFINHESAVNLRRGELSDLFQDGGGWVLYRIESPLVNADFEDENIMARVRTYLRSYQRGRLEDWAIAQAREFNADVRESGFHEAALAWNKMRAEFGPLAINFGSENLFNSLESFSIEGLTSQDLQGLSSNENFWRTAFSAQINSPSEPLVQGSNIFVFFPVEQTYADETQMSYTASTLPYWIFETVQLSLQPYFLNSEKLDNRFVEAYIRYFM